MALRTLSICAGVGGLDLGVRIARPDARCVAFVEREASAAASLVASMEAGRLHPAAIWSDLRTFDVGEWRGAVDCVLSGDPCQGNSVAGKRLGAGDDRWLLDRAIKVFDQSGADTFFRENVPGNLAGQLEVAIPALERLGCRVAAGIFSAAEAGASHRRERFFILAHRQSFGRERAGSIRSTTGSRRRSSNPGSSLALSPDERHEWARDARGWGHGPADSFSAVADTSGEGRWQDAGGPSCDEEANGGARRNLRQSDGDHVTIGLRPGVRHDRSFAPGPADPLWGEIVRDAPSLEPAVCRVAHGVAGRIERLRHCGNGVVPLAAALAWVRLHGLLASEAAGGAFRAADNRTASAGQSVVRAAA